MPNILSNWKELRDLQQNFGESGKSNPLIDIPLDCGWLAFIRNALGMSRRNLATFMGKTVGLIQRDEKREVLGQMKLAELETYAEPLCCKFIWTFLPNRLANNRLCKTEIEGKTINQMTKLAQQHDSQFLYVLIPIKSIEHIRVRHAIRVTNKIFKRVHESMIIENQGLPLQELKECKKYFIRKLLTDSTNKLWVVP